MTMTELAPEVEHTGHQRLPGHQLKVRQSTPILCRATSLGRSRGELARARQQRGDRRHRIGAKQRQFERALDIPRKGMGGQQPGDLLEIEYLDIIPESYGWTRARPDAGFVRGVIDTPILVNWELKDGWATAPEIPGVYIPAGPFMGTAGLAPSHSQVREWTRRETDLVERGGAAQLPDPQDAVPSSEPIASEGLRTAPPRENGGNFDIKQLTKGSKLLVPVTVRGGLYSAGDAHFAQGDAECCLTAIEMGATVAVRFQVLKGEAERHNISFPRFTHPGMFAAGEWAAPKNFIATMGMPITEEGTQENGDLNLAARNALIQMIDLLRDRGFTKEQAYVICSVAVDLKISNAVDMPNVTVSAFLPEAIFQRD